MSTLGRLKHLENTFKILIMGDASVGKTSILTRYADSHFGKLCHMDYYQSLYTHFLSLKKKYLSNVETKSCIA